MSVVKTNRVDNDQDGAGGFTPPGAEEILAKQRRSPGILVFDTKLDLLFMNREALNLNKLLLRAEARGTDTGLLPQVLLTFAQAMVSLMAQRSDPKAWESFHVQRAAPTRPKPILLRGIGLPSLDALLVIMEEFGLEACATVCGQMTAHLTLREQSIVSALTQGATNKEIGDQLSLSEHTVKNHMKRIMKKTGATTRTGVALHASLNGQTRQHPHDGKTASPVLSHVGFSQLRDSI